MGQNESTSSRYESSKVVPPIASTALKTPTQKHVIVAAISFGNKYSGYAYSSTADPLMVYTKLWTGPFSFNYKVPTQVLIEKNGKTFKAKAFGNYAETEYVSANDERKTSLFLFKRFMMSLDIKCGLNMYVAVEDVLGKLLPAITVFSLSIVWLKNDIEKSLNRLTGGQEYKPSEILWVFTVPAIWNGAAKQFMREAATQAGISNDHLEIVSEPEAASIVCRHKTPGNFVGQYANLSDLKEGEQYMVLNAGGDSVDFTIFEVVNSRAVNEVCVVSCGCMGGENVDNKFLAFLEEITGPRVLGELRKQAHDDEEELLQNFELLKRNMSTDQNYRERIYIPVHIFNRICQESFNKDFAERLQESKFRKMVTLNGEKLWISAELVKSFFTEAIEDITNHVKRLLEDPSVYNCKHILMVGSFSESSMLQEAIKNVCPGQTVIIPVDADFAVLKGAVFFGHDPLVISQRISICT